ncbi:MAG: FHA domain-containing protein [Ruminococcus sp.]|nr:FHA domain-containing protein [Ruminococcus sp.]
MLGKIKSKYGRKTFIYNISKKENINRLEADRLYQPAPVTLAQMEVDVSNYKKFKYDISLCVSLKDYLKQNVDAETILDLLKQFIDMTIECDKLKLNVEKVILDDFKYVFYNESAGQLKFIYIPLQNLKVISDSNVKKQFVVNLLSTPVYKPDTDMTVVSGILGYIYSELHFNIKSLKIFIDKLTDPEEKTESDNIDPKRFISMKYDNTPSENLPKENHENSFAEFATTDMTESQDEEFLTADDTEEDTDEFLTQDSVIYEGSLERILTNEEIIISKTPFTVGRYESGMPASMRPDYFMDSKKISRSHITIYQTPDKESEPDIFEIYDERSRNRTYVNDKLLEHKQRLRLEDGDKIRLPGETFIFHIKEK